MRSAVGGCPAISDQSSRVSLSRLSVPERDLAGDNGRGETLGSLRKSHASSRKIIHDLGHAGGDGLGIENVKVREQSFAKQAAVREAPGLCRLKCQHAYALLEGEGACVAYPMSEQMCLDRGIGDLAQVRAGVRKSHHSPRMTKHVEQDLFILWIEARLYKEAFEVAFER